MSVVYKVVKNYTLPMAAALLAVSAIGMLLSVGLLQPVAPDANARILALLGSWALWVLFLGLLGALTGAWYVGEQMLKRRKFERLLATDKRSEFASSRKDLEDLARKLPDNYRPRIQEKEAQFKSRR